MVVRSSYKWEAEALFVLKGRIVPESNRGNSARCSTEWTGACSVGRLSLIFMCSLKTVVWVGGAQGFLDWGGGIKCTVNRSEPDLWGLLSHLWPRFLSKTRATLWCIGFRECIQTHFICISVGAYPSNPSLATETSSYMSFLVIRDWTLG